MKNIVRAFVLVLTVTGSVAYTQIGVGSSKTVVAKTNWMPIPACAPGDPSACGMR